MGGARSRTSAAMSLVRRLRGRPDDIDLLVEHFIHESGHEGELREILPEGFMDRLRLHRWPGNVRELRNVVEATLAMGELPPLDNMSTIPPPGADPMSLSLSKVLQLPYKSARTAIVREFERRFVEYWLEQTSGNVSQAARKARMDRSHLFSLVKRHDLRS